MSSHPRNMNHTYDHNSTPNDAVTELESITDEPVAHLLLIPPKPPRSAFMCYTDALKEESTTTTTTAGAAAAAGIARRTSDSTEEKILNNVAAKWKSLTDRQRAEWEEVSRQDKVRFAREKADYKGPWEVPKRRARKHPLAPKRPMSAFLKYSQKRRQEVKETNPEMNNTDISRLLGELWRAADTTEKEPYVESEKIERAQYNEAIANWREEQAHLDAASRTSHHSVPQRSDDQTIADAPPAKKKRRENMHPTTSDSSKTTTAPSYASSNGRLVDRRIFRSYSGSSHPAENKPHPTDQRRYHPIYYSNDTARSHIAKGDSSTSSYYHHKPADAQHSYKSEPIRESTSSGMMSSIQPVEYPPRYHPQQQQQHQYRPPYPVPQHGENRPTMQQLPNTGSDLFDNGFHDPEPPFNPRQTRPSSHYNGYFFP